MLNCRVDRALRKHHLIRKHRRGLNDQLRKKVKESFSSVAPVTAIVLLISISLVPMHVGTIALFLVGALLLIIGMGFFQFGAEMAMMPIGEGLGTELSKTKKISIVVVIGVIVGFLITIAEPDLQVLAQQAPAIPNQVLILTIAVGVGLFLGTALVRIVFKIRLSTVLIVLYGILFALTPFVPSEFLPVAFDSGGVTTGPMTVPFIMALGAGFVSLRNDKHSSDDSFGLVAIASVGPILTVLLLGIFYHPSSTGYTAAAIPVIATTQDVVRAFVVEFSGYAKELLVALLPIAGMFLIFQIVTRRFRSRQIAKAVIGFIYTFIGLLLFLVGVNVGFLPVGHLIGNHIGADAYRWVLVPIGMLVGFFIVKAEPAVQVLNHQVEEITQGAISGKIVENSLSIGVAFAVGIAMVRILTGIPILWVLIPGYIAAIALTFFVPKIFVGIAFDSGGVASGPMTSTFLLPFAIGACEGIGGNVMTDAFGVVAMVAMTPLIAVQIMGLIYTMKRKPTPLNKSAIPSAYVGNEDEIIEYEEALTDG